MFFFRSFLLLFTTPLPYLSRTVLLFFGRKIRWKVRARFLASHEFFCEIDYKINFLKVATSMYLPMNLLSFLLLIGGLLLARPTLLHNFDLLFIWFLVTRTS